MKGQKSKEDKARRQEIKRRLKNELKKEIKPLLLGTLAMIGSATANQAVPKLLGKVLDQQAKTCPVKTSSPASNPLLIVVIGGGVSSFLRTTMLNRAQDNITSRLRLQVFSKLMKRNVEWFQTSDKTDTNGKSPAEIQSILGEDVNTVAETITTGVANLIRSSCSVIFATRNMLQIDAHLMSISVGIVPVIGTAAVVLNKFVKNVVKKQRDLALESEAFAAERVENVNMVKISSREQCEVEKYIDMQSRVVKLGKMASFAKGVFMGFMFSASSAALVMVFHSGGKDVAKGKLTHGELKSFATYSFLLGLGTSGIMKGLGKISQGMICADRVYSLMDEDNKQEETQEANKETKTVEVSDVDAITVENVSFAYASNAEKMVLKNISMDVKRGEVVALVGANGAGKSSLASILMALHEPNSGTVIAKSSSGNVDILSLDRKTQSSIIQLVPQRPAFFDMSIKENVTYTNPGATEEEIKKALESANCNGFMSELEQGLEYNVGRNGSKLSGGQRSRLALARALLSDPALLILDEPNSAMDAEGESAVAEIVHTCRDGNSEGVKRGLLMISHRAGSLQLADKIVVLKDGVIAETGSFAELCKNSKSELIQLMPELQQNDF